MTALEWFKRDRAAMEGRAAAIQEVLDDGRFRTGIDKLADEQGADPELLLSKAAHYLDEMMTTREETLPDFSLLLSRIFDRDSFEGTLHYEDAALDRLKPLDGEQTLVITTAHRSYLDFLVRVPFAKWGFEREYRFAGANLRFWPMGPLGHRLGISYVRRGKRDPLYNYVMRQFVGWLTEHRANFMWALEGGRTRTGKLLRPKLGLLSYVADAFVDGRSPGVMMVPTTIVYEYLNEVFEYANYGRGAEKKGESPAMMLALPLRQRKVPEDALVFVGIGEPVALGDFLKRDGGDNPQEFSEGINRAALEVCRQVDAATPITAVALVLLPLLERDGVAMSVDEVVRHLEPVHQHIARRGLPAPGAAARDAADAQRALELLRHQELVVTASGEGGTTYAVAPGRHIEAAYYRNSLVHHFVIPSVIELSLVRCASAKPDERVAAFVRATEELRDLLAYEFFFPEGDRFGAAIRTELAAHDAQWADTLGTTGGPEALLGQLRPHFAPQTLAPFLEAHGTVAEGLAMLGSAPLSDERAFRLNCLAHAELELRLGRLVRPDAASINLYDNPLELARSRQLLGDSQAEGRAVFADSVREFLSALALLEHDTQTPGVS